MRKLKLVYIEWEDATSQSGWHKPEEVESFIKDTNLVQQTGWIYKEDDHVLILASRLIDWGDGDRHYGQLEKIPKTWIKKRRNLSKYI